MTWEARVHEADPLMRNVHIFIADVGMDMAVYAQPGGIMRTVQTEPAVAMPDDIEPTLTIPAAALPALLAALSRHLGAVEHPVQLRRDYEHERGRVDRLIAHLTGGAK